MEKVDDNVENMEICKKFCGICPMFKDNQLKEAPPHALFCTQGKSTKASTAKMTGCNCPGCGLRAAHQRRYSTNVPWKNRKLGVCLCVVTRQPGNVDSKDLAQIKTFVVMGPGDQGGSDIIIGSARQDLSKIETGIQTLDRSVSIISTTGIPFPASTRNHKSGDYITGMNHERVWMITDGFATGFLSGMYSCFCFQVHPTPQVYWTMVRSPTGHGQASF